MSSLKKLLLLALLAAFASVSFATGTGPSYNDTAQAQPPVDCKKDPTDPRCKKGK